jgi:hypothetical protein
MKTTTTTLLDAVLPEFDFSSRHTRCVAATPERVAEAVNGVRLGGAASLLVKIRSRRASGGRTGGRHDRTILGAPRTGPHRGSFDLQAFRAFDRPGWAQGAMSLRLEPLENGSTLVTTETRVRCVDDAARRRFAIYWLFIRVFSGWLRRDFLRRIARIAEGAT